MQFKSMFNPKNPMKTMKKLFSMLCALVFTVALAGIPSVYADSGGDAVEVVAKTSVFSVNSDYTITGDCVNAVQAEFAFVKATIAEPAGAGYAIKCVDFYNLARQAFDITAYVPSNDTFTGYNYNQNTRFRHLAVLTQFNNTGTVLPFKSWCLPPLLC